MIKNNQKVLTLVYEYELFVGLQKELHYLKFHVNISDVIICDKSLYFR